MTDSDFDGLKYIKRYEIEATGALIVSVKPELIYKIDDLRERVGAPVRFVKNGITSGDHKSKEHPDGIAADIVFLKSIQPEIIFKKALEVEFRGIGIYWNEQTGLYSFHVDLGPEYRFWTAYKKRADKEWIYRGLVVDPKNFI